MLNAKSVKSAVRPVAFLALAAALSFWLSGICEISAYVAFDRDSPWRWWLWGYANALRIGGLRPNSLDVASFGASANASGFSPLDLYDETGLSSYNFGGAQQMPLNSYFLLKEVLKKQNPKVVFFEASQLVGFQPVENLYRVYIDPLPISANKLEAIAAHVSSQKGSAGQLLNYLSSISKFRQSWKTLVEFAFTKIDPEPGVKYYNAYGFTLANKVFQPDEKLANFSGWTDTGEKLVDYQPEAALYTEKMIELCRQKGIDFVLYKTPRTSWTMAHHNSLKAFAERHNVPLIDFHMRDALARSGLSFAEIFADGAHLNIAGGIAVSRYLGKWLNENYSLPSHKGDPAYAELDAKLAWYERALYNNALRSETNMLKYLNMLADGGRTGYTAIFSIKEDGEKELGDELRAKLAALGFVSKFDKSGHSFIGVWRDGRVLYEKRSKTVDDAKKDLLEYKSVLPDGRKYYVKSAGARSGNTSAIIINGIEYGKGGRGFNIAVYDSENGYIADSVCWDTHADAGVSFKR